MKSFILLYSFVYSLLGSHVYAAGDSIGQGVVRFSSTEPKKFVEQRLQNPKEILTHFNVVLDRGTKIISPLTLGGTATHPVLKVSMEKCVLFICQKANLDTEFSVKLISGKCELNAELSGDMSRSSAIITELYSHMRIFVCYNTIQGKGGELHVSGQLVRASTYASGMIQGQLFQMLQRQFPAILEAARKSVNGTMALRPAPQKIMVPPLF